MARGGRYCGQDGGSGALGWDTRQGMGWGSRHMKGFQTGGWGSNNVAGYQTQAGHQPGMVGYQTWMVWYQIDGGIPDAGGGISDTVDGIPDVGGVPDMG